ncbi:MAG: MFS transporter, partial [Microbacterium sp.]
GEAVGAPASGALADRWGQRPVLLGGVAVHLVVLLVFTLGVGGIPDAATVALAGVAGLTLPQVGALSRARWLALAPDDTAAAFAFEGVVDEVVYIIGPALVGLIAVAVDPRAAMLIAGVLIAVFVTQFAVHRTHRAVPRRGRFAADELADAVTAGTGRRAALIALTFAGMVSMGAFFGGSQTALTAFAAEMGVPDAGALLYAVMAVGSAATTVSMVLVPDRIGPWTRWITAGLGMLGGAVLMTVAGGIPAVVVAGVVAGAFQGPMLLTVFRISGSIAEQGRSGVMMTLTASGVVVGLALGAAIAGPLAQAHGSTGGFAVTIAAALMLLLLGVAAAAAGRVRRRQARVSSPL